MAEIGPNFKNELAAAGLVGLPIAWDAASGAVTYADSVTQEERDAVAAVLAAHDPETPDRGKAAAAAIAAGCAIASAGTPALNATYHASGAAWQMMRDEALYIAAFGEFSGGLAELDWTAVSGDVLFETTAQFMAVARAIGDWLTHWHRFAAGRTEISPGGTAEIA
ncbi:MAG TPA: hypothetical protein VEC60_14210 [Reyranella sp.]|nr:hypothetical protein [Reyranella sp.]